MDLVEVGAGVVVIFFLDSSFYVVFFMRLGNGVRREEGEEDS